MITIIPAIDLIDAKCVRLSQGDYNQKTVYNENPLKVAKMFEDAGITRLHLVDLDGAKAKHIVNYKVLESIASKTNLIIDFGGGLGIDYNADAPPPAQQLWTQLLHKLDARGFGDRKILLEPGRSLVGNAGVCVTEVLYLKPGEQKNFLIVDAAMNDLPRPAMYEAFHRIVPVAPRPGAPTTWDVVGPVCESGDWLGRDRALAVQAGDLLAVLSAGAYCMSMASNYNTRGRATELLVQGEQVTVIRQRETAADQMRLESLLP